MTEWIILIPYGTVGEILISTREFLTKYSNNSNAFLQKLKYIWKLTRCAKIVKTRVLCVCCIVWIPCNPITHSSFIFFFFPHFSYSSQNHVILVNINMVLFITLFYLTRYFEVSAKQTLRANVIFCAIIHREFYLYFLSDLEIILSIKVLEWEDFSRVELSAKIIFWTKIVLMSIGKVIY